jgi:hypothetical protein
MLRSSRSCATATVHCAARYARETSLRRRGPAQTAKQWVERETAALEALQREARAFEAAAAATATSSRADLDRAARDVAADRAALDRREADLRCRLRAYLH